MAAGLTPHLPPPCITRAINLTACSGRLRNPLKQSSGTVCVEGTRQAYCTRQVITNVICFEVIMKQSCKHCILFDIESAKDKAGRVQKRWAVKCFWESKEPYPESVLRPYRPKPSYVMADMGGKCECYEPKNK